MDSPNPDSGEEYPHTNTQLYNVLNEQNRFKIQDAIGPPHNAPPPGQTPTMDGFVTDYISNFTGEMGRQPTYEEYAQIMTGFTPEQVPVLNGLARGFGVFDHWFCEVPSQTLPNRSFWTAATSSGSVWNPPTSKFIKNSNAETIFNRLDSHGKTWKVYVSEPMAFSCHGMIHYERLKDQFATHFVPFSQFEADAANGELPDFSFIEPNMIIGHNDYHPAFGRSFDPGVALPGADPPASILGGEEFLSRIYAAYRGMQGTTGSTVWNTTLLIGWDEPGGTYDHVPPPAVPSPDKASSPGEFGFGFDRSGYRDPRGHRVAVDRRGRGVQRGVPPHVADRHVARAMGSGRSVHRTRRGRPDLLQRLHPRHPARPQTWPVPKARPVPPMQQDMAALGAVLSTLGQDHAPGDPQIRGGTRPRDRGTPEGPQGRHPRRPSGQRSPRVRRELVPAARKQRIKELAKSAPEKARRQRCFGGSVAGRVGGVREVLRCGPDAPDLRHERHQLLRRRGLWQRVDRGGEGRDG